MLNDDITVSLRPYADIITVCPEMEIGMGVPRDPVRIVSKEGGPVLVQLNTGKDITAEMKGFSSRYMDILNDVDGFILKDRSPSCGIGNVKVYQDTRSERPIGETDGFFAAEILRSFKDRPIETDSSLSDRIIRERFIDRIYVLARNRMLKGQV